MKVDFFKTIFFIFFIFGVALNISFSVFQLVGNGEVMSQISALNTSNELVNATEIKIPIELLDLLAVSMLPFFYLAIKKRQYDFLALINQSYKYPLILWVLFIIFAGSSLLLNHNYYSQAQILVMFLHWLKLVEILVIPIILIPLLRNLDAKSLTRTFLLSFILSSVILLATYFLFNYKVLVGDRMETSIVLMIGICITFYLYELETHKRKLMRYEKSLYFVAIFLGSLFILQADKRGAIITFLVLIIVVSAICIIKKRSRLLMIAFLIPLTISSGDLFKGYQRSIVPEYTGIQKTRFRDLLIDNQDNLVKISSREILKKISKNLDGSGAERVAKYIYSFNILSEYKILGDGFWGIKYRYDFVPDSILQVAIEIGYLGFLICISFFIALFRIDKPCYFSFVYIKLAFLPFFIASLFCNPVYMFRPMALLLFFTSYASLKFGENDPIKNSR